MEVLASNSEVEDSNFFYDTTNLKFDLTISDPSLFTSGEIRDYIAYLDFTL